MMAGLPMDGRCGWRLAGVIGDTGMAVCKKVERFAKFFV
jgi:hypothetical protein